jgi:lanosterol synthase
MQACLESPQISDEIASALVRAYSYLQENQIDKELDGWPIEDRDTVLGGWCFGSAAHAWPVSDCTAEALCAILAAHERLQQLGKESRVSQQRLERAVSFVLSRQNADGGFSSFERQRAGPWLEKLNSSEMFGDSGIRERSYAECTGSCLKVLRKFEKAYPGRLTTVIQAAIERGRDFLIRRQRADGSYNASWGINFTYAAFFVAEGFIAADVSPRHPSRGALVQWLLRTQLPDGGWGEHYSSCMNGDYTPLKSSRVVMTAWAALALLSLDGAENQAVRRAVAWLQARQQSDGSWPREGVNGVFSQSALIDYRLYQDYFALWAITRFLRMSTSQ